MSLSPDLVAQFVKITNDNKKQDTKKENITYGIVQGVHGDEAYIKLDGSKPRYYAVTYDSENEEYILTSNIIEYPTHHVVTKKVGEVLDRSKTKLDVDSYVVGEETKYFTTNMDDQMLPATTTVAVNVGDRVIVMIKNHSAVITGNLGKPATTTAYVDGATGEIKQLANNANTNANNAINKVGEFEIAIANKVDTKELTAELARINNLETNTLLTNTVKANEANVKTLNTDTANIEKALVKEIDAETGEIKYAKIEELETNKLDADSADIRYAKIDFTNIEQTAIATLFATSGIIENVTMENGSITGHLVGVTISGDLIEGNTIKAEKLVIKGDDGLYYKLNTDGVKTEAEQTEYNSLNGSVIAAKSITATKIDVSDLVAFGATIGGFNISTESLYSGVKESVDNPAQGIFMDREGQLSLGDENNYIRYFKDDEGNWRLEISAENILFGANAKSSANDIKTLTEHVKIGVYNDNGDEKPCVELSEGDSYFKQIITNDKTMFTDGSIVRTQIDAEGVTSENITVGNEYRQGGFVWKARANGNLGLVWKGGNS